MKIDGLTLRILPADEEFPEQDRETVLLNWLLAEWHREQKEVDSVNDTGNNSIKSFRKINLWKILN